MFRNVLTAIAATVSLYMPAQAQERPVELSSAVQLVRPADAATGKAEELVEAASVVPQDLLVFSVSYKNVGGDTVSDLLIVNPVPASVRVTEQSASAGEVSVDGGNSWGKLGELVVTRADGVKTPATVDDISHLRWKIAAIAPGQAGAVTFRATVR